MLERSWRAEYDGHEIRIENHISRERLYVDGKLVDERQGWYRMASQLSGEIPHEDGTVSILQVLIYAETISTGCDVGFVRRNSTGEVLEEGHLPVQIERDGNLFGKVWFGLVIGLLLLTAPEGTINMIHEGLPPFWIVFRATTGAGAWLLFGFGVYRFFRWLGGLGGTAPAGLTEAGEIQDRQASGTPQFQSWSVRTAADGTLSVRRTSGWHEPRAKISLVFMLMGVVLIAFNVAAALGWIATDPPIFWDAFIPFVLLVALSLWTFFYFLVLFLRHTVAPVHWRIGPNFLDVRQRFFHRDRTRRYSDATLTVTFQHLHLQLVIEAKGKKKVLAFSPVMGPVAEDPEEFCALAALVTTRTGWPPPHICPACSGTGRGAPEDGRCQTCGGSGRVTWEDLAHWFRQVAAAES